MEPGAKLLGACVDMANLHPGTESVKAKVTYVVEGYEVKAKIETHRKKKGKSFLSWRKDKHTGSAAIHQTCDYPDHLWKRPQPPIKPPHIHHYQQPTFSNRPLPVPPDHRTGLNVEGGVNPHNVSVPPSQQDDLIYDDQVYREVYRDDLLSSESDEEAERDDPLSSKSENAISSDKEDTYVNALESEYDRLKGKLRLLNEIEKASEGQHGAPSLVADNPALGETGKIDYVITFV